MKKNLTAPSVLEFINCDGPFVAETDASNMSVGAVLAKKKEDGKIPPVQYASRAMKEWERKYPTCEKEALAVISEFKKVRVYLLSSIKFRIIADHKTIKYAFQRKDVPR